MEYKCFKSIHNVIEEAKYLYFSEGFDSYDHCIKESKIVHSFFLLRLLTKVIYFKFLMKLKIGWKKNFKNPCLAVWILKFFFPKTFFSNEVKTWFVDHYEKLSQRTYHFENFEFLKRDDIMNWYYRFENRKNL